MSQHHPQPVQVVKPVTAHTIGLGILIGTIYVGLLALFVGTILAVLGASLVQLGS
jgi:hypothetical protein